MSIGEIDYSNVLCLVEFSSNTTHIYAQDINTGEYLIHPHSEPTKLGTFPDGTQSLNPAGIEGSISLLRNHEDVLTSIPQKNIRIVGTGALRDATDSNVLKRKVLNTVGMEIDILSGETEAHYGALGVHYGLPNTPGIVWDMGGRSSEFSILDNGRILNCISLPLGTQPILEQKENMNAYIAQQLAMLPDSYTEKQFSNLIVVGGTPRRMIGTHQPHADPSQSIKNKDQIHGYHLGKDETVRHINALLETSEEDLPADKTFRENRIAVGSIFSQILDLVDVKNVTACTKGFRFGVIKDLERTIQKKTVDHNGEYDHNGNVPA